MRSLKWSTWVDALRHTSLRRPPSRVCPDGQSSFVKFQECKIRRPTLSNAAHYERLRGVLPGMAAYATSPLSAVTRLPAATRRTDGRQWRPSHHVSTGRSHTTSDCFTTMQWSTYGIMGVARPFEGRNSIPRPSLSGRNSIQKYVKLKIAVLSRTGFQSLYRRINPCGSPLEGKFQSLSFSIPKPVSNVVLFHAQTWGAMTRLPTLIQ